MPPSPIPPFDVVDPFGRRRRIHPATAADTVADLAAALGRTDRCGLTIDGRPAGPTRLLTTIDELVEGAQVECGPVPPAATGHTGLVETGIEFAVVTGPSCGAWSPLARGRHGIGRSPHATIRLADRGVEVHHAVVDVGVDGSIRVTQLTGRTPVSVIRSSTETTGASTARPDGTAGVSAQLRPGDTLVIGVNRIEFRRRGDEQGERDELVHCRRGTIARIPDDPWHREVRRGPSEQRQVQPTELVAPQPEPVIAMPAGTALVGAAIALVGALVIAGLLGQTMFAVFALVGAFASAATWVTSAFAVCRRRRTARRASSLDHARFVAAIDERHQELLIRHRRCHIEISGVLDELRGDRTLVWHHRLTADGLPGGLDVVIGRGSYRAGPVIDATGARLDVMSVIEEAAVFRDVAVPVRLAAAEATAVRGDREHVCALLRSILVQVATWVGPADIRLVVIGDPAVWDWVRWFPHTRAARRRSSVLAPDEIDRLDDIDVAAPGAAAMATLLLIDDPSLLALRTGPLRRFMSISGATTLVAVDASATVPSVCRHTLVLSTTGGAEWLGGSPDSNSFANVVVAGLDEPTATRAARALAPLIDPEHGDRSSTCLPDELTLAMLGNAATPPDVDDIVLRWSGPGPDPSLRAPIGASADGVVEIDLVADGPHALVAGTTGSGKSELLRTLVASMATRVSPVDLNFVLIDYKGGATFDSCTDLPHTVGMVTDLDDGLAERALISLDAELSRREQLLRSVRAGDLAEYRTRTGVEPIPRLVVVIDEFATLAHELPDFLAALVAIAQRGRSLGVHLVLATQRPAGVITDDIRANTDLRVALRVNDPTEARDVVGDDLPASFAKSVPGRAMLRLADERIVFQAARCTGPMPFGASTLRVSDPSDERAVSMPPTRDRTSPGGYTDADDGPNTCPSSELVAVVAAIRGAFDAMSIRSPRRPWLEPLPARLDHEMVELVVLADRRAGDPWWTSATEPTPDVAVHDAIGIVDDPANQRRLPLRWDPSTGNLLIVGALGSGRTSTVLALAAALCRISPPERCHLYVIDGMGDRMLDGLAPIAHCGAVVRLGETERIDRLLRRLTEEIDRRGTVVEPASTEPQVVLFVDGLGELRRSLDTLERFASLAMLDRIVEAGAAVGVATCLTVDGSAVMSTIAAAERWILRLDDPVVARTGRRRPQAATGHEGRLRIASSGLQAQVATGAGGLTEPASRPCAGGPADLVVLPAHVEPAALPASHVSTDSGRAVRHLVIGLSADRIEPVALCVPDGEHVFIGGAARTGATTALARIGAAWAGCEPNGTVVRWSAAAADHVRARVVDHADAPTLLAIDDAERVQDRDGLLAAILHGEHPHVTIAAAARVDAVRAAYGHWTREVARSRCGLVMTAPGEVDGDLLGVMLPRRAGIAHRPGLAWLVDVRGHRLVQVAGRMPA